MMSPCAHAPAPGRRAAQPGALRPALARLCLAGLVVLLAAGAGLAQTLTMRSGEHARFTRLTLPVTPGQSWTLGRVDDGYGLRLGDGEARIDSSGVFARIPRSRLQDIRPTSDGVDLVLACDCHAIAFREGALLVIDLRDGAPPPGARFETRLAGPRQPPARARPVFDWTQQLLPPADRWEGPQDAAASSVSPSDPASLSAPHRDLLARQFSRAVVQGLITADIPPARRALGPVGLPPVTPSSPVAPLDALANLRIGAQTALDRAQGDGTIRGTDREGEVCPPDSLFDLAGWATDRPVLTQLAEHRSALLGEFDRTDAEAVIALAQFYLHAGFGAEAAALLETLPVASQRASLLRDVALIMDHARPLPDGDLAGHVGCDGVVAMWAVLAAEDLAAAGVVERAAVRRAFGALPAHLRRHLGPPLAQRFLDLGDPDTAQALRNAITGAEGPTAGIAVLDAGLELARGRPEAAGAAVETAAATTEADAPTALATLLEARLAAGLALLPGTADNLAGFSQLHAGTELGARFARLEAVALATEGHADAAFAVRDRMAQRGAPAAQVDGLSRELLAVLARVSADEVFLPRALAETVWRDAGLAPADRLGVAARLLDGGFPEHALAALHRQPTVREEALLLARAALALGRPADALRAVVDHAGPEAEILRAEALLALGEHRAAIAAFTSAGSTEGAERAAWLGGLWPEVAGSASGAMADLAARRGGGGVPDAEPPADATLAEAPVVPAGLAPEPVAQATDAPLAEAEALLVDVAEARRILERMLANRDLPND